MDVVSAIGYALGYLGGGLLFALNVMMSLRPAAFGLASPEQAVRVSFVCVGVWWAVFSIPLLLLVREPQGGTAPSPAFGIAIRESFITLSRTLRDLRRQRTIGLFLIAYWLYIDGVDTIIRMAVDYGMSIGFESKDLIAALLLTQFIGFPAAVGFGFLGNRIGTRRAILSAIAVYLGVCLWGAGMRSRSEFYVLAAVIGLVQGGIQALSRSFFAKLIPPEKSAEYFGLYNMLGKFAVVLGPALMGLVGLAARNAGASADAAARFGIGAVALLFAAGGSLFWFTTRTDSAR
ncbi:MAG: MFS transporter [Planctomycetes bacterium]|nr:MFS transporter [Planctomycetota bacterium]